MSKLKRNLVSKELLKYPYCGRINDNGNYLSDKICYQTIKVRERIIKELKWAIIIMGEAQRRHYCNYLNPFRPIRPISFISPIEIVREIVPPSLTTRESNNSIICFSEKTRIDLLIKQMPSEIDFTNNLVDEL